MNAGVARSRFFFFGRSVGAGFAKCAAIASTRAASHRTRPRPLVIPKETMGGVAALGVALNLGGDKATHNVEKLLEALRDVRGGGGGGKAEADARAAIVALETFFSERLGKGELRVAGTKAAALDASAMKRAEWLGRQYKLFLKRLCALVAGGGGGGRHRHRGDDGGDDTFEPVSPRTTTLALAATMECARSEHPGTFAADPWVNALRAATTGDAFTPELLGAMSSRYFRRVLYTGPHMTPSAW